MKNGKLKIGFNSPAVLGFALLCVAAFALKELTGGKSNDLLFSVYGSSLLDPLTYVRCIGHVIGHGSWEHLFGNMTLFLVLGPALEEKYGTANLIFVMLATAIVTAVFNMVLFPHVRLLGASGIVFAFLLLSSITNYKQGVIPLTFILVALMYIGKEVYNAVAVEDNISQMAHIVGGLMGSGLGFVMNKNKMSRIRE